jgi:3',5'-cyclic AMP phosphodiesterase CpdA
MRLRFLPLALVLVLAACLVCPAAFGQSYRFVVYGDTRTDPDVHRLAIAEVLKIHPEFVLQTGDLVADGSSGAQWKEFDGIVKALHDAGIPYYPARGNHDLGNYYIKEVREPYDSGNGYYYAFTRHGSRFIILDSMDPDEYDPSSAQYRWLEKELATAHAKADHFFVLFHESPFSVGPHGPTPIAQQYLHPLFVKYHPTAVFCGHDHLYYRTKRDGVSYIVTGGGGAPLYPATNKRLAIKGDVYDVSHHVVEIDVDGPNVAVIARRLDGSIIDQFSLPQQP